MFDNTKETGTQQGSVAMSLASHQGPWSVEAVQQQHVKQLETLADRWAVSGWKGILHASSASLQV